MIDPAELVPYLSLIAIGLAALLFLGLILLLWSLATVRGLKKSISKLSDQVGRVANDFSNLSMQLKSTASRSEISDVLDEFQLPRGRKKSGAEAPDSFPPPEPAESSSVPEPADEPEAPAVVRPVTPPLGTEPIAVESVTPPPQEAEPLTTAERDGNGEADDFAFDTLPEGEEDHVPVASPPLEAPESAAPPTAEDGKQISKLEMTFDSMDDFMEVCAPQMKSDGMFIRTELPKPEGTEIDFSICLQDGTTVFKGLGEVVLVVDGPPSGMVMRFASLDDRGKEALEKIITGVW